jgi:hypothetical protein
MSTRSIHSFSGFFWGKSRGLGPLEFLTFHVQPNLHRFNEPLGPLAILPNRRKQKVLMGSAFSTQLFDHDKDLPKKRRKRRRPWL